MIVKAQYVSSLWKWSLIIFLSLHFMPRGSSQQKKLANIKRLFGWLVLVFCFVFLSRLCIPLSELM